MKPFFLVLVLLISVKAFSQSTNDSASGKWTIEYDRKTLRVPGNILSIEIPEKLKKDTRKKIWSFLEKKTSWNNFRIEVDGGIFRQGKIHINDTSIYLKDKAIVVRVYKKKSSTLLFTQNIPFNYETKVQFLLGSSFGKVPGSIVKYGVRTIFDNGFYEDLWPSKPKFRFNIFKIDSGEVIHRTKLEKPLNKFIISANGGYFLRRYLVVENDPFKIKDHAVSFTVSLEKNPAVADTVQTLLDYIYNYTFDSRLVRNYCIAANENENNTVVYSKAYYGENGHNLEVFADIYKDAPVKDTLLLIVINDLNNCEHYNYLVNTKGGTIKIYSKGLDGANGSDGNNGFDGTSGSDGSSGSSGSTTTETITNDDGSTSTKTTEGSGGNGSNGSDGSDGSDGGNGGNGSDGSDGGDIFFKYTQAVQPYLHLIEVKSIPGAGGSGGHGGTGGRGGAGGRGGSGGSGSPSGSPGSDGNRGRDGSNGSDGSRGNNGKAGKIITTMVN